ncbi:MAG: hypothetical protein AADX96_11620 [Thiocapsa sp. C3-sup]
MGRVGGHCLYFDDRFFRLFVGETLGLRHDHRGLDSAYEQSDCGKNT